MLSFPAIFVATRMPFLYINEAPIPLPNYTCACPSYCKLLATETSTKTRTKQPR
uniref:Uncharacterized protein n=1 Tax=Arundo donax TaxID=35708 RepID=A0A0A9EZ30_ARUDO